MKITKEIEQDIINLYNNKTPTGKIADKYKRSEWWVIDKLRKLKIPIRRRGGGIHLIDLSGKKFGKYTVLYKCNEKKHGNTAWVVKCECGNVREVTKSSLTLGLAKSCGKCHARKNWKGFGDISGHYYSCVQQGAKARKLEFDLSIEYIWDIYLKQNRKCAISGRDISFIRNHSIGGRGGQTASLDRIDSSKGYVRGNVQWVDKLVNVMKWNIPEHLFIEICKTITEYRNTVDDQKTSD